jgi:hypothetical protein
VGRDPDAVETALPEQGGVAIGYWAGDPNPGGCCSTLALAVRETELAYGGGPGMLRRPAGLQGADKIGFLGVAWPPPLRVQFPAAVRSPGGQILLRWNPAPAWSGVDAYTIYSKSEESSFATLVEYEVKLPNGGLNYSVPSPV